ncbi:MAG: Glycerophosphodiester phosphodiesterase [Actinomycetota bacterium]|nr:Glycerophosphodiester phosphodiesterase [Actinomycetota bacterium]
MHPFLQISPPFVIAHRGGTEQAVENSDTAFAQSIRMGVRYLESDVRTTSDGVAILQHDPDLTRVAHYGARIDEITWHEIARIELPDGGRMMRLDEALTTWPGIRWNLDVKDDRSVVPTVTALLRARVLDRVCVASFSNRRLLRLRAALGPDAATGATWREALAILRIPGGTRYLGRQWQVGDGRPVAVQVPPSSRGLPLITRGSVAAAHALGMQVHAWTINDPRQMRRLLDLGVDGVVTDVPSVALEVIANGAAPSGAPAG